MNQVSKPSTSVTVGPRRGALSVGALILLLCFLFLVSLFLGTANMSLSALLHLDSEAWQLLLISRLPRAIALVLAGTSLAVAGLIMQMLVRNRFVEPSTAGTVESATMGILAVTMLAPGTPVVIKMAVAAVFALAGTGLFLLILRRVPLRSPYLVPVVGLVLGGIIQSVTIFFAYQHDLMQALQTWTMGDFSGVLRGRYELLWIAFALSCIAYIAADRFTVLGMGEQFTTNLGLNHKRLMLIGMIIVAAISAVVVVTAGSIPFLGLLVPNVVSLLFGDNMRRSLPWVALLGALFVLACDIVGRLIIFPHEIPIGTVVGVVGSALFLYLLLKRRSRFG